jgi:hypothetical protein
MAIGKKTGGRQKGTLNKNKQALIARLAAKYPEYDPVIEMAAIANDPEADQQLRFNANKEVAQYMHAKRKAIEHSGPDGEGIPLTNLTLEFVRPKVTGTKTGITQSADGDTDS